MATEFLGNIKGPKGEDGARGLPGLDQVPADAGLAAWVRARDDSHLGRALDLVPMPDKPPILSHSRRVYEINQGPWGYALSQAREGARDAKVLIVSDSTGAGIGGSQMAAFPQKTAWPSGLAQLMDDLALPTAHGLAIPKSSSGAMPSDSRWTLGAGWAPSVQYVGFGGKSTNYRAAAGTGTLAFNDPRVLADRYDVYYTVSTTASYGQLTVVATGGSPVTVQTGGQSAREVRKVTVYGGSPATTNNVAITNSGTAGDVYIVGVEPWLSTQTKVRVGNAAVSGSTTGDWVGYHDGNSSNGWNGIAGIAAYQPDLVIIDLGINDASPAAPVPVATYLANVQQLIQAAQAAGASVVLKTMIPSVTARAALEAQYVEALHGLRLPIIDLFNRYGSYAKTSEQGWMADDVHGTDGLYEDEARYMFSALITAPLSVGAGPVALPPLPALPVAGWTEFWSADQIPQTIGSDVNAFIGVGKRALKPETGWTAPKLATGAGGRRVLRFNGTTDGLSLPLARTQPQTVVVVGRLRTVSTAASSGIIGASQSTGARGSIFVNTAGNLVLNAGASLTLAAATVPTTTSVFLGVFNGNTSVASLNGTEVTGAAGTEAASVLYVGRLGNSSLAALDIERIVVYPFALSAAQRASVVAALTPAA